MKSSKSTGSMTVTPSGSRPSGVSERPPAETAGAAKQLLVEGDTCWRRAHAARAAVLIDAADYFAALRASLLAAQWSILILGWELHSRTRLEGRSRSSDGAPRELGKLLLWLLDRRPE